MKENKNIVQEYIKRGGLVGYARAVLSGELEKAKSDKGHVLWPVILLLKKKQPDKAAALLVEILMKKNVQAPLDIPAVALVKIPLAQELLKYAEKNFDDTDRLDGLPTQIIKWAGIGVGLRESKAAGGRKKGKKHKEKIIADWESSSKKLSIPAFAVRYFEKNGGRYNAEGKKQGKVPSIRTIEKYLREHLHKK